MQSISELNIEIHPITQKTIDSFVERVKEHEGDNLLKIILFGSVARGEANKDSDIDILIILNKCSLKHREEIVSISVDVMCDMDYDENAYVQLITISEEESKGLDFFGLMFNVDRDGAILYDSQ